MLSSIVIAVKPETTPSTNSSGEEEQDSMLDDGDTVRADDLAMHAAGDETSSDEEPGSSDDDSSSGGEGMPGLRSESSSSSSGSDDDVVPAGHGGGGGGGAARPRIRRKNAAAISRMHTSDTDVDGSASEGGSDVDDVSGDDMGASSAEEDSGEDDMSDDDVDPEMVVQGKPKSSKAKRKAYGNEEPVHILPPHMFAGEGSFTDTVAALNPDDLERMIRDAQKAAAELGNLTTCLCCDAQCKLSASAVELLPLCNCTLIVYHNTTLAQLTRVLLLYVYAEPRLQASSPKRQTSI